MIRNQSINLSEKLPLNFILQVKAYIWTETNTDMNFIKCQSIKRKSLRSTFATNFDIQILQHPSCTLPENSRIHNLATYISSFLLHENPFFPSTFRRHPTPMQQQQQHLQVHFALTSPCSIQQLWVREYTKGPTNSSLPLDGAVEPEAKHRR